MGHFSNWKLCQSLSQQDAISPFFGHLLQTKRMVSPCCFLVETYHEPDTALPNYEDFTWLLLTFCQASLACWASAHDGLSPRDGSTVDAAECDSDIEELRESYGSLQTLTADQTGDHLLQSDSPAEGLTRFLLLPPTWPLARVPIKFVVNKRKHCCSTTVLRQLLLASHLNNSVPNGTRSCATYGNAISRDCYKAPAKCLQHPQRA